MILSRCQQWARRFWGDTVGICHQIQKYGKDKHMTAIIGKIDFSKVRLPDGRWLTLSVEGLAPDAATGRGQFLEHVFDRRRGEHTDQLIAYYGTSLFVSDDLGETWKNVPVPIASPAKEDVWGVFTTDEGRHLAVIRDKVTRLTRRGTPDCPATAICVFDPDWKLIKTIPSPGYIWLGNYSIDQAGSTIMYGDYPLDSLNGAAIRRSRDGGLTWEECFRVPTSAQTEYPPETLIKHFHTCQHDPWKPGRWYVSNGDSDGRETSSLWISEDDGDTWKRSEHVITNLDDFPAEAHDILRRAILRMTSPIIEKDAIYAVTDDHYYFCAPDTVVSPIVGGLSIKISKESPHEVTILDNLGKQALRNNVSVDDYRITVSESKNKELNLNVVVYDRHGWSHRVGHVPLSSPDANAGPGGASSVVLKDGYFFTNGSRIVFDSGKAAPLCVLRWQVIVENAEEPTCPIVVVPKRKKRLLYETVFYTDPGFTGCSLCGGMTFEPYGNAPNRLCSRCRSLERQRAFAHIYQEFLRHEFDFTIASIISTAPLLHFAPTQSEKFLFSKLPHVSRITTDVLASYKADLQMDICDMRRLADGSIGSAFAASVLEFVHDERRALSEVHRILCEGGRFFFAPAAMRYRVPTKPSASLNVRSYGQQAYDEHKVAYYRDYGDVDLIALMQEFFVVKTYYAFDHPTATMQTWYCGIKSANWKPRHEPLSTEGVEQVDIARLLVEKRGGKFLVIERIECDTTLNSASGKPITWKCIAHGEGSIQYAWYIFKGQERIETQWYSSNNELTYSPKEPGIYKIQAFAKNETEKIVQSSPAIHVQ